MRPFTIQSESLRATIAPSFGGAIAALELADGTPILRPSPAQPRDFTDLAMYLLCPWSNRIAHGRFEFDNVQHAITSDWPDGSAIHGVLKNAMVMPLDRSPMSARFVHVHAGDERWPWSFRAIVRHEVDESSLVSDLALTAIDGPMPAGLGFHPHFAIDANSWVRCPEIVGRYPTAALLPTGSAEPDAVAAQLARGCPIGDLPDLDDCLLGSLDGATLRTDSWEVRLSCSTELLHSVVFTGSAGSRGFLCLEPVSHATNGVNLPLAWQPGIVRLERGESMSARLRLTVTPR